MEHQVISCFVPPNRKAFTELLKEYYALMIARIEAGNGFVGDGSNGIAEFWDEVDVYMPPQGRLFLAQNHAGEMIGCGMMKKISPDVAELKRLYVRPQSRGTGLGRHLVERRIAAAREMGVKTLLVDTLKSNVEMQGLYHKLGFQEIDVYPESSTVNMAPELLPLMVFFRIDLE
ncbi:MAG: GNAT family N-acetyltransferase [Paracoccaceae bacterium]|nr:GNAT family N-acetyltransferase [Paracoccaceae bacterium]MDG1736509.1 GNAT family N-acetyltransferase [Paracoccaceae bacterium]MDG2258284.1 GNAT family N-acetyltransferase [Paracoccaceae bacterium]